MYSLAHDTWDTREVSALQKVMDSGRYTMGPEVAKFEDEFASYCQVKNCVGVGNGLDAIRLILEAYGISEGDLTHAIFCNAKNKPSLHS